MIFTRNTPARGALARLILTLAACAACTIGATSANAQQQSVIQLASYYQQMEHQLVSQGLLRQERRTAGIDAQTLARNFMAIAMRSEYSLRGGAAVSGGGTSPLRRWEQPIRLGVHFGASVSGPQQQRDLSTVQSVAQRLQRASGLQRESATAGREQLRTGGRGPAGHQPTTDPPGSADYLSCSQKSSGMS